MPRPLTWAGVYSLPNVNFIHNIYILYTLLHLFLLTNMQTAQFASVIRNDVWDHQGSATRNLLSLFICVSTPILIWTGVEPAAVANVWLYGLSCV